MIVATAGHVDHGKTSLVRALTGVDTDRLAEEKRRGMSIELGFAYRATDDGRVIGFVDVPGHERFVHTMAAGVGGVDHALVVVAADDGPMPQTHEHVAILELLGVDAVTLVVTKIDRVPPARVHEVEHEARALLDRAGLRTCGAHRASSATGEGVDGLWTHLQSLAATQAPRHAGGALRMSIDRCFSLDGIGCVVTGTVLAGRVAVDDDVVIAPGGIEARVRSVHAHGRAVRTGRAGERCALNLVGTSVSRDRIARGDWVVSPGMQAASDRLDVELRVLASAPPLSAGRRVHVHVAAAHCTARVVPIGRASIAPGASAYARIVLDEPSAARSGDRLVVRDGSARHTIAGGVVLDALPPTRVGRPALREAALAAPRAGDPAAVLGALLRAQPEGVVLERFFVGRNVAPDERAQVLSTVGATVRRVGDDTIAFEASAWRDLGERIVAEVDGAHRTVPARWGPTAAQLRAAIGPACPVRAFDARLQALVDDGEIARMGAALRRPGHVPALAPADAALWQRLERQLTGDAVRPPSTALLAQGLRTSPQAISPLLQRLSAMGLVVQLEDDRWMLPQAAERLASHARTLVARSTDGAFSVAEFRDATGIGRKRSIKVLEHFDRIGLTRRIGERRRLA